jgi:hypothetical protein
MERSGLKMSDKINSGIFISIVSMNEINLTIRETTQNSAVNWGEKFLKLFSSSFILRFMTDENF